MADWSKLSDTEKALVTEYLQCLHQVKSYKKVFPDASDAAAAAWAYEPFNRPHVKEVLAEIFSERVMQPSETLARLQEIAKGAAGNYIDSTGKVDFEKLAKDEKGYLLKRYKTGRGGVVDFEFVDYQQALNTISKIQGLLDGSKVTVNVNTESLEDKLTKLREKVATD